MKVLLATDGSDDAQNAVRLLRRLSCCETIDLTVLTVTYLPTHVPHENGDEWVHTFLTKEKAHADEAFAQVQKELDGTGVKLKQVIQHGHVGHAVTELANVIGADLIVVGAKGHSQLDRLLLGSTSDFIATQAECSVLVVRPTDFDPNCGQRLGITIGFDGSIGSWNAIDQFLSFDCGENSEAEVVTVVRPLFTIAQEIFPGGKGGMDQQREEAEKDLEEVTRRLVESSATTSESIVQSDHVGSALCEIAREKNSDLVIVGDTGRSELSKLVLGSVPNYVLRHSDSSVLICRAR